MIMEDRDIILMEIPHQLDKLKRPALQQMCKRFGLKANGKNVDMVRALTRLRQSQASSNISESFVAVERAPAPRSPLGSCGTLGESSTVVPPPTSPLQQLQTPVKAANRSSTTRKRSLCSDDVPEHEPPAKRGRRQNKRKGRASKPKRKKTSTDEEELLCMSQNTLQAESSLPSTPQTDEHPLPLLESASEQRRKRKRWSDEATMTPPILLDELPAPKRTRRATYSVSPPSRSAPAIQHVSEVETESEIADVVLPVSPPSHSSPQVSEVETESEIADVVLPVSPPVPLHSSPQVSEVETESEIADEVLPVSLPVPLHSSPQVSEVETEREITEDVPPLSPPDPTSDLESSTRQRHSTYAILERDSEMMDTSSPEKTSDAAVSDVKETSCSEEEDTHTQIMTLLEQRVEERKLDPNYKPVFTASCSKIPVKKSTSAKFDQLHQRRFNRMTSIVEHQRNKEKRAKEFQKRSAFKTPENPRRFEPSVLKPQNASFNFGRKSTLKTPASTASKRPTFPKTAETVWHSKKSFDVKSSLKKTSSYIPRKGKVPDFNFNIY